MTVKNRLNNSISKSIWLRLERSKSESTRLDLSNITWWRGRRNWKMRKRGLWRNRFKDIFMKLRKIWKLEINCLIRNIKIRRLRLGIKEAPFLLFLGARPPIHCSCEDQGNNGGSKVLNQVPPVPYKNMNNWRKNLRKLRVLEHWSRVMIGWWWTS